MTVATKPALLMVESEEKCTHIKLLDDMTGCGMLLPQNCRMSEEKGPSPSRTFKEKASDTENITLR